MKEEDSFKCTGNQNPFVKKSQQSESSNNYNPPLKYTDLPSIQVNKIEG